MKFANWIDDIRLYHFKETAELDMIPEGRFEFIFQLGNSFHHNTISSGGWSQRPGNFVGGLHSKAYQVKPMKKDSHALRIRMKPQAARYFLNHKLKDFRNHVVDLNDVWNKQQLDSIGQFETLNPNNINVQHIDQLLSQVFKPKEQNRIELAVAEILKTHGNVNISQLANQYCMSNSNFRRVFSEEVGMSPKEFSRIIRVQAILEQMQKSNFEKMSDLAYANGYFDQAHFINDFKLITGKSPGYFCQTKS